LRAPADALEPWPPERFEIAVDDLLDAHRSLGGTVELTRSGTPVTLSGEQANALQRALQEALSNARRHAPGAPVTATLAWHDDRVQLSVRNPLASARPAGAPGGGYGLIGMRERFESLPRGGSATVQDADGWFTLRAEAGLR
ncbi:sensor histidine kinase, partial [Micropruina sp.]|uniref:sensor histidine kinase n=1 Tax=Micropruina sp. TaxID=2737536 RepID=UPI0039E63198